MQPIILDVESIGIPDVETYLEPISAPANYKDPEKIAAYEREERAKQIERAALDVDLGQIICVGIYFGGVSSVVSGRDWAEVSMLENLWQVWGRLDSPMLVTFGGLNFDVPLLLRRSLYLGIKAPYISCDRYRQPQQIDLMSILSMDGKLKWRGLQFYLNRLGYPHGGPDITGAEIAERYAAGDWAAIEQHCRMDVDATKWLAERIGAIPKMQPAEKAVGAF